MWQHGSGRLTDKQQQKKSQDYAGDTDDKKCIAPTVGVRDPTAGKVTKKDAEIDARGVDGECGAALLFREVVAEHRMRGRRPARLTETHAQPGQ